MHTRTRQETEYVLQQLGLEWYLNFTPHLSEVPEGASKVPFLPVNTDSNVWLSGQAEQIEAMSDQEIADLGFLTRAQLAQMAQSSPGTDWYIFGEANRYGYMTGTRFAPVFHYFASQLKQADPVSLFYDYVSS